MTSAQLHAWVDTLVWVTRRSALRAWARLGWPGGVGIALAILACILGSQTWALYSEAKPGAHPHVWAEPADLPAPGKPAVLPSAPELPQGADASDLLAQIEQHVKAQGLAWPRAQYRLTPLNAQQLSELEVSFTLQGSYPKLREFLASLLNAQPALAVRDLGLRRAHSDAEDVEAKLVLVVYLRDGWPHAKQPPAPPVLPAQGPVMGVAP